MPQDASREMAVNFIVIGYSCQALFNTMWTNHPKSIEYETSN